MQQAVTHQDEGGSSQNLGEDISQVKSRMHMHRLDNTLIMEGVNPPLSHINMLHLGLERGLVGKGLSSSVVHLKHQRTREVKSHLIRGIGEVQELNGSVSSSVNFSSTERQGCQLQSNRNLRNYVVTQIT